LGSLLIVASFVGLALLALGPIGDSQVYQRLVGATDGQIAASSAGAGPAGAGTSEAAEPAAEPGAGTSGAVPDRGSAATSDAVEQPAGTASEAVDPVGAAPDAAAGQAAASAGPPALKVLLDEDFQDNRMRWADSARASAWLDQGAYRLAVREPGMFVAVGAPVSTSLADVVVSARFRKVGGPPGGGYGVIVRDQEPTTRDGIRQSGRYYVLEVGDRGEVGVWRREDNAWVDLVPWTASDAVRRGDAANDLEVWATGAQLTLVVNGIEVARQIDRTLTAGGVGVFVGGDGNDVALEHLLVRTPVEAEQPVAQESAPAATPEVAPPAAQQPAPRLPITRVRIPGIELDSEAVPADLVAQGSGVTWAVPAFKIGHAQDTAGAGGQGNAVLVGHVDSRGLGNVFEDLHNVRTGDAVEVLSGARSFSYRVVDVRNVGRTDVSVVQPTETPSVTLITCTGHWLPLVFDYAERLVVRAELADLRAQGP
jgi:LPXTG-site transpeptidase (sortase) family protein